METSALNVAHEKQRRAEALLREGRFEEAAKCHETVAGLLSEAHDQLESSFVDIHESTVKVIRESSQGSPSFVKSIHAAITLESLALQRDYHKRQASIVRMKQAQYEEYKATLEQQKDYLNKQAKRDKDVFGDASNDKSDNSLRHAIYKTIDEQDNLLSMISIPADADKAFKHPKDTGTVIEELRTVNCQLRCLVGNLLSQLEAKDEEVRQLTEKLEAYTAVANSNLSNLRPDDPPPLRLTLPPLTPLEMPLFDFTSS